MSETQPSRPTVRRLVVVADNDPVFLQIIARVLLKLDLVPVLAANGVEAIATVEMHRSALVCAILDIEMPAMNGIDAAHTIQRIAPDLALILITGLDQADFAARISHLRLAGTLYKPFSLVELRVLIGHAMADDSARGRPAEQTEVPSHTRVDASYR